VAVVGHGPLGVGAVQPPANMMIVGRGTSTPQNRTTALADQFNERIKGFEPRPTNTSGGASSGARSSHRPQRAGKTKCSPAAGSDNSMPEGPLLQSH
jgi:hypothetical protein